MLTLNMPLPHGRKLHKISRERQYEKRKPISKFVPRVKGKRLKLPKEKKEIVPQPDAVIEAIEFRKKLSAMQPAERIRFLKAWLRDASNKELVTLRKLSRKRIAKAIQEGIVVSKLVKGSLILYNAKYKRFASPLAMRFGRKLEPIVVKGQVTSDGTIARNSVYKVVVRNVSMARKTYLDVADRTQALIREASALIEASKRGVPVVEFVRAVISKKTGLAVLYTVMPHGYETLAKTRLGRDAPSRIFLEELGRTVGRMHNAGILHQDLDPENILWNKNPHSPSFMFLDFELASVFDRKITLAEAALDLRLLIESLKSPIFKVEPYSDAELEHLARGYSAETGYPMDIILGHEKVFPGQEERDTIRDRILKRLGLG
ncbi:MAG: lipopolysaccharide kinase InaA family protein [Candidatus Diapherotrites archaeon]